MIDWVPQEDAWRIFYTTKQEKLRLDAALKGYFTSNACDNAVDGGEKAEDAHRAQYAGYLKRRIRPAVEVLSAQGCPPLLEVLFADGILTLPVCRELLSRYADGRYPQTWLTLLRLVYGSSDDEEKSQICRQGISTIRKQSISSNRKQEPAPDSRQQAFSDTRSAADLHNEESDLQAAGVLNEISRFLETLFPFLTPVLLFFGAAEAKERISRMGTDGRTCLYDPDYVSARAREDLPGLRRLYLHILLHCLIGTWEMEQAKADRLVEQLIEEECEHREVCRELLGTRPDPVRPGQLDDHSLWPRSGQMDEAGRREAQQMQRAWELLRTACTAGSENGQNFSAGLGIGRIAGNDEDVIGQVRRSRHDYRRFLRRFAVPREEAEIDPESFDYIYYTLGMERFGNLPLIEPLEYKEGHKLEELVIAIDTSGSCSNELVRSFLEESYAILGQKENFFRDMSVYILQCDCTLQDAVLIRSEQDWKHYCENLKIKGRSGTDFRPVFRYVQQLRDEKKLRHLKCLIYFTDGDGIYPTQAPDYETAFVFVKRKTCAEKVPGWALQLEVDDLAC